MKSRLVAAFAAMLCASSGCGRGLGSTAQPPRERLVRAPSSIAALSSDRAARGLSSEMRFGGALGRSALYLKFPNDWRAQGTPRKAFLTLSAREGSATSSAPVTLEVWRINADWQPQTLRHWSDKPALAPPYETRQITPSPARDLRIDVSEILRFAAQNPERDFGIAVIASGSEGPGATFSTGFAGGQGPRLELYLH